MKKLIIILLFFGCRSDFTEIKLQSQDEANWIKGLTVSSVDRDGFFRIYDENNLDIVFPFNAYNLVNDGIDFTSHDPTGLETDITYYT